MNDQNKQQMPLSEEIQNLEEADLDKVTGGTLPWNHPFDSGTASTTLAATNVIKTVGNPALKHVGVALDAVNLMALNGSKIGATVLPNGDVNIRPLPIK